MKRTALMLAAVATFALIGVSEAHAGWGSRHYGYQRYGSPSVRYYGPVNQYRNHYRPNYGRHSYYGSNYGPRGYYYNRTPSYYYNPGSSYYYNPSPSYYYNPGNSYYNPYGGNGFSFGLHIGR